jgi:hypothetical protein
MADGTVLNRLTSVRAGAESMTVLKITLAPPTESGTKNSSTARSELIDVANKLRQRISAKKSRLAQSMKLTAWR